MIKLPAPREERARSSKRGGHRDRHHVGRNVSPPPPVTTQNIVLYSQWQLKKPEINLNIVRGHFNETYKGITYVTIKAHTASSKYHILFIL